MNLKKISVLVSFFIAGGFFLGLSAQSIDEIKANRQDYIWGEGMGETLKAADQEALVDIIGQISVQVENKLEILKTEKGSNFEQTLKDVVKTYSSATLKNTERIVLQNEPDAKVFRYVKRSELNKIFESRKNKIIEFAHNGEHSLQKLQVADALRYFYWAQTLLRSHPEANDIRMTDLEGNEVLLITWLSKQINDVFAGLSIRVDKTEDKETYLNYLLEICYNDQPVRNLDYTYWGGQDWSSIVSAKDGIGIVELPKTMAGADIRVKVEYAFEGESNIDLELRDVMDKVPQVSYKSSYLSFSSNETPRKVKASALASGATTSSAHNLSNLSANGVSSLPSTSTNAVQSVGSGPMPDAFTSETASLGCITKMEDVGEMGKVMAKVKMAINQKNYTSVQALFTPEGFDVYQKLLQYGHAKIIRDNNLNYYKFGDLVICRSIPMSFRFKSNNRTFIEDIVFYFDKENKICNLTFGLSSDAVKDIASNDAWSEQNRVLIMSFLENYKTAYSLKRYDYINSIFSDDALIITGYVTKRNASPENPYLNNKIVSYNRQTKSEYMKKLRFTFDSNEFINIRFAENSVRRSGKGGEIYGIQIRQDYYSANYGDMGYLFLLVDLSDTLKPQIHIRTWQPEKNPDGSVYGLSDF